MVSVISSNGLVILNSKGFDFGNYYCDISNSGFSVIFVIVKIIVLEDIICKIILCWVVLIECENGVSFRKVELDKYIIYLVD